MLVLMILVINVFLVFQKQFVQGISESGFARSVSGTSTPAAQANREVEHVVAIDWITSSFALRFLADDDGPIRLVDLGEDASLFICVQQGAPAAG